MWGNGCKFYWGRKEGGKVEGIVVVFAWISSQERHLKSYMQLYSSLGWNSLVCHAEFLNLFSPEKATSLAFVILNELVKELRIRPSPVVFAAFSGGSKACMYKVLQIIDGKCEAQPTRDEYRMVKNSISGHIYDSGPIDFTSDLATRFVLHPMMSWITNGVASGLDTLFLNRFESQRAEYWQTLYSSVNLGGPFLILCSKDDDLAPYQIISNFAQRLQDLGGDVKLVKWSGSPHVGHYRHYPTDYKAALTELLGKATSVYSRRVRQNEVETRMGMVGTLNEISESICNLQEAAVSSNQSLQRVAIEPSDHFFLPSSMDHYEGKDMGSMQSERNERLIHIQNPPSINPHGVLGTILFEACVPKNVENWDIRLSGHQNGHPFTSTRRNGAFNPIKCLRSRL